MNRSVSHTRTNYTIFKGVHLQKKATKIIKEASITGQWFFVAGSSKELNIQIAFDDDSHST